MSQVFTRTFRQVAVAGCLCGAGVAAGCSPAVSTQQEVQIGADYSAQINRQLPMLNDQQTLSYVNQIGQQIARIADPRGIRTTSTSSTPTLSTPLPCRAATCT